MAVMTITADNFEEQVLKSEQPVLLDFWAAWCGPCKMQDPIIEQAAEQFGDQVVFGKVNVDEEPALAGAFQVMSIPTLIVFHQGKLVSKNIGLQTLAAIKQLIPSD